MDWRYVGGSVRGSSHVRDELPCQDFSLVAQFDGGELLAVISDGAGSARLSDIGSRLICTTLLEEVADYLKASRIAALEPTRVDAWFEAIVKKLHVQAHAMDAEVRDLAATLVAALVGPDGSAFVQIGDGAIVIERDGGYTPVFWPANGEYANTTFFVTDDTAVSNLSVECGAPPVNEVAVFSDGLQMLALRFASKEAHAPFFEPLFVRLRTQPPGESAVLDGLLKEYLESGPITARTDDDKSLILGSRRASVAASVISSPASDSEAHTET